MIFDTEIKQWGNSLALRISGAMAQEPMFSKGTAVVIETSKSGMTIKLKNKAKTFKMPFSEHQLIDGLDSDPRHADLLATPSAKEFSVE